MTLNGDHVEWLTYEADRHGITPADLYPWCPPFDGPHLYGGRAALDAAIVRAVPPAGADVDTVDLWIRDYYGGGPVPRDALVEALGRLTAAAVLDVVISDSGTRWHRARTVVSD